MSDNNDNRPRRPVGGRPGGPTRGPRRTTSRSSAVVVEKKKKRLVKPGAGGSGATGAKPKIQLKPRTGAGASPAAPKPTPAAAQPATTAKAEPQPQATPESQPKAVQIPKPDGAASSGPQAATPVKAAPATKAPTLAPPIKTAAEAKPSSTPRAAPKPTKPAALTDAQIAAAAREQGLSVAEFKVRMVALQKAQAQAAERAAKKAAEAEARQARMREEQELLEAKKKAEEEAELKRIEEEETAKRQQDKEEQERLQRKSVGSPLERGKSEAEMSELEKAGGRIKKKRNTPPPTRSKGEQKRRRGKLTIVSALSGNDERQRSLAAVKRKRERERQRRAGGSGSREKVQREVTVPETITIAALANRMAERGADVVKYLMQQGTMSTLNDVIDADTAQLIVEDFGHTVKRVSEADVEDDFLIDDTPSQEKDRKPRPPVIAIMGHVDHGKTSLLDALRATDVAAGEAGGITQHIGAYQLQLKSGDKITVLDTPGHAAFADMRTRGAEAVDIVILVVAADDGVKPQTIESIRYAKAAGKPIIVAINKIDKYDADPKKVETDLLQYEVITESMSGDVQAIPVSAKEGTGLDALAEAITLQAELMELKANPKRNPDGLVIESRFEKGRGAVTTLLIKRGTLKRGDMIVADEYMGKVKAMMDERGKQVKQSGPSTPVEVMGLDGAPMPGEPFAVVDGEQKAREIVEYRQRQKKKAAAAQPSALASMEQMMAKLQNKEVSELPLLVKADVQGSAEAIKSSLEGLSNSEVKANVIYAAAGGISESDVQMAMTAGAPIIAFNVRPNKQAKELADREGVEIRYYSIIYELIEYIEGILTGMIKPERRETFIGYAEILEVFNISKLGKIAGCRVTDGRVERGSGVRLLRDDVVIHEGTLKTLKRFKDEVEKVQSGMECGMAFENYEDLRKGDQIECFTVEMVDRSLEDVALSDMEAESAVAPSQDESEDA
ncbi:translation initiation factor IF-2 [uncultured Algimonas sp.]|uniref:translation initiation factor IF-2 n=1 Tax=uncultured Algimonas sp. TaxID=1547920 RepID=UPI002630A95E|nr:translation initiation factor IF-2 [uncultured Algimonas sp.]